MQRNRADYDEQWWYKQDGNSVQHQQLWVLMRYSSGAREESADGRMTVCFWIKDTILII